MTCGFDSTVSESVRSLDYVVTIALQYGLSVLLNTYTNRSRCVAALPSIPCFGLGAASGLALLRAFFTLLPTHCPIHDRTNKELDTASLSGGTNVRRSVCIAHFLNRSCPIAASGLVFEVR